MTGKRPKVVDFSTHFSGSVATQLLMQTGADVVKVENPRVGDGNRGMEPLIAGESMLHVALNAGKRSLTVDLRSPEWSRVVAACANWADVVVVGARPSAARRRGLDFETLRKANPSLVYCLITGYGDAGPWADYPSHGLNTDALAGLVPIELQDSVVVPRADYRTAGTTLAGLYAAYGIMAALWKREQTGQAQHVSVSIWGAAMAWSWRDLTTYANLGQPWLAYQDLGTRYAMYETADKRAVLVCPIERKYWTSFCQVVGLPEEWKSKGSWEASGMDYGADYPEERAVIAERIAAEDLRHWCTTLERADIPFAPVLTVAEALASEQAGATGVMTTTTVNGALVNIPRTPVTIRSADQPTEEPGAPIAPPPGLGEHTEEILRTLLGQP